MGLAEWAGVLVGVSLAPWIALGTRLRRGRVFHPRGAYYTGRAEPSEEEGAWARAGERLSGRVLLRVSGGARAIADARRDVVGFTLRFHDDDSDGLTPHPRDQDLLMATIRSLATIPADMRRTDTRDLLANTYWAAMPYRVPEVGEVAFRLVAAGAEGGDGDDGVARLDAIVEAGRLRMGLEARTWNTGAWRRLVDIEVLARVEGDDRLTRFSPLNAGRGIAATGFVHGIRRVAYAVGQRAR